MQIGSGKTAAVINMTPMIDILLVLLITFMLLPNRTKGLPSEVPDPPSENQRSAGNSLDSVLRIRRDRSIEINSQPVATIELEGRLRSLFVTRPGGALFIDGVPELEFADVASVIDLARGAGWTRFGLMPRIDDGKVGAVNGIVGNWTAGIARQTEVRNHERQVLSRE